MIYKPYTGKVLVNAGDCIQLRVFSPQDVSVATVIKSIKFVIDVPDREEHFTDIFVPEDGLALNIQTPYYYTTAVRLDNISDINSGVFRVAVINKNPCFIRLYDINNNPVSAIVDITWQGFTRELR